MSTTGRASAAVAMDRMMQNPHEMNAGRSLIVVVDDDEAVRDSLEFSLGIEGFAVRSYPGAEELLAEAGLPFCDCLIVDQNMPGLSGLGLISILRARKIMTPAILMTGGNVNAALRERAAAVGVPIVEKPLLGPALLESIRQSVTHRAARIHG